MTAVFLMLAIISEVVGTLAMRASGGFTRKALLAPLVAGYLLAFTFLTVALSRGMSIGVAYGIWAAAGIALTAVLGKIIFKEPLTKTMLAGIGLIGAGVLLVELGAAH